MNDCNKGSSSIICDVMIIGFIQCAHLVVMEFIAFKFTPCFGLRRRIALRPEIDIWFLPIPTYDFSDSNWIYVAKIWFLVYNTHYRVYKATSLNV